MFLTQNQILKNASDLVSRMEYDMGESGIPNPSAASYLVWLLCGHVHWLICERVSGFYGGISLGVSKPIRVY